MPAPTITSAGQSLLAPVQLSATSHAPAEALQTVDAGLKLHAVVDWAGVHTWHDAAGFVVPGA
ncbi:hypothetical protein ACQKGO_25550 [Corallococcus interemptor]|uniref:hypothetical protein n=1 Tax=Corallococcus interemptor TaxID=2316720 RepID=UPI003CFC1E8A